MVQYQKWMFDATQWHRIPQPKPSWHLLNYHIVTANSRGKATPEQERYFDYMFACMMQVEVGWH